MLDLRAAVDNTRAGAGLDAAVRVACVAVFIATFVAVAAFSVLRPAGAWDMLPYAALALEQPGDTNDARHARAYAAVKGVVSPTAFTALTENNRYRMRQYQDPDAFASMLPMYAIKTGYVSTLRTLVPVFGYETALRTIGLTGFAALGALLLVWSIRAGAILALPFIGFAAISLQMREQAAGLSPDLWATVLVLASVYAIAIQRVWIIVPLLALATTFRPDTLVMVFALLLAFAVARQNLTAILTAFGACLAVYFWSKTSVETVDWWTHYWFSNIENVETLESFAPSFSISAFVKGHLKGAVVALAAFNWPMIAAGSLVAWYAVWRSSALGELTHTLLLACALATMGKFALFPLPDDRIHAAPVLAAVMLLATALTPALTRVLRRSPPSSTSPQP